MTTHRDEATVLDDVDLQGIAFGIDPAGDGSVVIASRVRDRRTGQEYVLVTPSPPEAE